MQANFSHEIRVRSSTKHRRLSELSHDPPLRR